MTVDIRSFTLRADPYCDVINITDEVQSQIKKSEIKNGLVNVHVSGSTGAISTTEYEPGLVKTDIETFLEKIIPYKEDYAHHKTWGDHNGAGHLRSFLLGTSETFPVQNGKAILGTWQQIIYIENDEKSRTRTIYCTIIGE
ncbi:MAG: YjbQ family protein [Candidatus Lokiarchaeota archaeon]|nr:YjbQ family protein [Candidatus Lokiarchaeota archaeon]MBD3200093.1 YjbQ family protein [Candidatus Lokiarchaeota archaeon]